MRQSLKNTLSLASKGEHFSNKKSICIKRRVTFSPSLGVVSPMPQLQYRSQSVNVGGSNTSSPVIVVARRIMPKSPGKSLSCRNHLGLLQANLLGEVSATSSASSIDASDDEADMQSSNNKYDQRSNNCLSSRLLPESEEYDDNDMTDGSKENQDDMRIPSYAMAFLQFSDDYDCMRA